MSRAISPFSFHGSDYTDLDSLVNDMGLYWWDGKALLQGGALRDHVKAEDPSFASSCAAAEKELRQNAGEGNRIFFRWLCRYPGIRSLYWQDRDLGGLRKIASCLASGDETAEKLVLHMLRGQFLSAFVKNVGGGDALCETVRYLEKNCAKTDTPEFRSAALVILESLFAGDMTFEFDGQRFAAPKDLSAYLQQFADESKSALSKAAKPLFRGGDSFDPRFEAWILLHGHRHELTLWKARFEDGQASSDGFADELPNEFFEPEAPPPELDGQASPEPPDGFDDAFTQMLTDHADRLDDPTAFSGLMKDFFPAQKMHAYLLTALYRMDVMRTLREEELTEPLAARFEKRLVRDLGVREAYAKWAVGEWFRCYGERVLGKKLSQ